MTYEQKIKKEKEEMKMAYAIKSKLSKEAVEENLRNTLTKLQNEIGIQDHGWALGSEVAEVKAKIAKDKLGDWRAKYQEAYNLGYFISVWEKSK